MVISGDNGERDCSVVIRLAIQPLLPVLMLLPPRNAGISQIQHSFSAPITQRNIY